MSHTSRVNVPLKAIPFPLSAVRLQAGPFKAAMDLAGAYLLDLDPDRLLSRFREYAGLEPKAEIYGGWEAQSLSGHSLGHYLSGCSLMYGSSGDPRYLDRVNYIVEELAECQKANGNGFASGMPNGLGVFADLATKTLDTSGFNFNGVWVPWYNLHKTYAGLIDAYLCCQSEKAKAVLIDLADWACRTLSPLSKEQFQTMLACEHGGMNESLATLYELTGKEEYLALAQRFNHHAVLDPLMSQEDKLTGLHANTQIPKVIGLARQYELTGNEAYRTGAKFFWDSVIEKHTYVNGGNSEAEHFRATNEIQSHLTPLTAETCNTYNMLKLNRSLFGWEPKSSYADYYERALYNHILASQEPLHGMMIYFCSLKPGHFHTYSTPHDSFWCCTGTGMENHVKYGDSIYFHHDDTLFVNLFIASDLTWRDKGVVVHQETSFPEAQQTTLTVECASPTPFTLKIRKPYWIAGAMDITVNGESLAAVAMEDGYLCISRDWNEGDRVEVSLPMGLHTESILGDANKLAVLFGPIVLAGTFGGEGLEGTENKATSADLVDLEKRPKPAVPVLVCGDKEITDWVKPVAGKSLTFETVGVGDPNDVTLIPFFRAHHQRYTVYWDTFTTASWAEKKDEYLAEQARLEDLALRSLDRVVPEMQPERDHQFAGETTEVGNANDMKWRRATEGGWFSYQMKVASDEPVSLNVDYWGGDGAASAEAMTTWSGQAAMEFDILVEGETIATQKLTGLKPDHFVDVTYDIPESLTKGKERVEVKFQAKPDCTAGPVYGCRVVKRQ